MKFEELKKKTIYNYSCIWYIYLNLDKCNYNSKYKFLSKMTNCKFVKDDICIKTVCLSSIY